MIKHANISVFVPHLGCPNMCSFCNQHYIAGTQGMPNSSDIENAVNVAQSSKNYNPKNTELAFFGGSFTAIEFSYMLSLLKSANKFVKQGVIAGIRISTRPDAINAEILSVLKEYGVTSIELGAQSMDDNVLALNKRGHTALDVKNASALIKEHGFSLGLQMMTGLYGDNNETAINTAKEIIALRPNTVRIYPTIVLENTMLANLYKQGKYSPQGLEQAVNLAAELLDMFNKENITVIRVGLHTIDQTKYVAGPWHPAFRELCESAIYLKNIKPLLNAKGEYNVFVKNGAVSKMAGQKRSNLVALENLGYKCKILEDNSLNDFQIKVQKVGKS